LNQLAIGPKRRTPRSKTQNQVRFGLDGFRHDARPTGSIRS
jgi:hypothetical protein